MTKIVVAINVMILNPDKISSVLPGAYEGEVFFVYDNRYKWSLFKNNDDAILAYYPGSTSIEDLASLDPEEWQDGPDSVRYSSKEIGTKEAKESFFELYTVLQEKKHGMDKVLDEIIASDIPF